MGYTHDWYINKDFTDEEWKDLTGAARWLQQTVDFELTGWDGTGSPTIDEDTISFNGNPSCETFILVRKATLDDWHRGFQFCKTKMRPYDTAVVFMLDALKYFCSIDWTSDGDERDWAKGHNLFRNYLNTL